MCSCSSYWWRMKHCYRKSDHQITHVLILLMYWGNFVFTWHFWFKLLQNVTLTSRFFKVFLFPEFIRIVNYWKSMFKTMVNIICKEVYTGIYTGYNVVCCNTSAYFFTKCVTRYRWIGEHLSKDLLATIAYDSSLRPASNQIRPTDLKVSFGLICINKQSELEKKLVTTAYMMLKWRD